jgi:hypothetical protein
MVNILKETDFSKAEAKDMIKRMNKILGKADVELTLQKIKNRVNVGNKDGSLTEAERNLAREKAKTELQKYCGGEGMKIWLCDVPCEGGSGTVGFALFNGRNVFVQPYRDSEPPPITPEDKARNRGLAFMGGVDTQYLLPNGTPDKIYKETLQLIQFELHLFKNFRRRGLKTNFVIFRCKGIKVNFITLKVNFRKSDLHA